MKSLVTSILEKKFDIANNELAEMFYAIMEKKLFEMKKMVAAKMYAEMDVSKEKPEYDSIEDQRKTQVVQNAGKTSIPGTQNTNDEGKGDLKITTIAKTIKEEDEQLDEARVKIIKARVRGGKIQRRKKVSNVPGMTIRGGKLTRMSPAERRKRKMGAKRGKVKRRAKRAQMQMKRKRSMMKRRAMGL